MRESAATISIEGEAKEDAERQDRRIEQLDFSCIELGPGNKMIDFERKFESTTGKDA